LRARLVVVDESGFSLLSPLKSSWSPRGETPTIRTSLSHQQRLNLIGALCVSPGARKIKLIVHSRRRTLRGEEVIAFLKTLLRKKPGLLVLVWDRHPIHQRRKVKAFLAQHPRLHVYEFPSSAPELNPVEWIWQQVDDFTAGTAPRNRYELRANVMAGIARVRRSAWRLWAGFVGARLNVREE
jgi:DDE superfamily endonuclease